LAPPAATLPAWGWLTPAGRRRHPGT
jgi:hypothetical protein